MAEEAKQELQADLDALARTIDGASFAGARVNEGSARLTQKIAHDNGAVYTLSDYIDGRPRTDSPDAMTAELQTQPAAVGQVQDVFGHTVYEAAHSETQCQNGRDRTKPCLCNSGNSAGNMRDFVA